MMDCYADVPYEQTASYWIDKQIEENKKKHEYANNMDSNHDLETINYNIRDTYSRSLIDPIMIAVKNTYHKLIDARYKIYISKSISGIYTDKGQQYCYQCNGNLITEGKGKTLNESLYSELTKNIKNKKNEVIVIYLVLNSFLAVLSDENIDFNDYVVFSTTIKLKGSK